MQVITIDPISYFQALSDPTRVRIVRLLADSRAEACLCDLSEALGEPDYKLSRHVKVLRQAGILSAEKEGRWIYHKIVRNVPSLKHLCASVQALPDSKGAYAQDFKNLTKRIESRTTARCKTDSAAAARKRAN